MRTALLAAAMALAVVPLVPTAHASPPLATWIWSDPHGTGDAGLLLRALARAELPSHRLDALGMVTFRADAATAHALAERAGGRLDADRSMALHLDQSVPAIHADAVKRAVGDQRAGSTVLVIDTGIDSTHPDFTAGRNLAANVQPLRTGGLVVATRDDAPVVDEAGHGTHVAGIIAGSGASLGTQDELHGRFTGVYAVGRVASFKASSAEAGQQAQVEVVAALEGFEWALDHQQTLDIRVVSNSWGEEGSFDPDGPVQYATRRLYLAGMTVVFSAGNSGEDGPGTLNRYCVAPWVLCVAAADLEHVRQPFSSRGTDDPDKPYDHPDLSAPGLDITSTRPVGRNLDVLGLVGLTLQPSAHLYGDRSGTSMAAPHVAGAAALLQAANPGLSPDQVMELLVTSAVPMTGDLAAEGAGFLDVGAAYEAARATVGSRDTFLAGETVRYAGAASGDAANAQDPVAVGVLGQAPSSEGLDDARERLWAATPVGIALLLLVLGCVVVGTRSRFA